MPRTLEYEDKETIERITAEREKNDALDIKTPLSKKRGRPRKATEIKMDPETGFTIWEKRGLEKMEATTGYSQQAENLELFRRYGLHLDQVDETIRRLTLLSLGLSVAVVIEAAILLMKVL